MNSLLEVVFDMAASSCTCLEVSLAITRRLDRTRIYIFSSSNLVPV
jgi:hypothetical protein